MIILAGIVFLGAFILFIGSFAMCVNLVCCRARLRRKYERMKPAGYGKALCAKLLFGIPPVVILFMIAIHILASNAFSDTLQTMKSTAFSFVDNTFNIIDEISPAVGSLLDDIAVNVNISIKAAANSVDFDVFDQTVGVPMTAMISAMRTTEEDKKLILTNSDQITTGRANLNDTNSILKTQIDTINAKVGDLMGIIFHSDGSTYLVNTNHTDPSTLNNTAFAIEIAISQAPDTSAIFSSIETSPDLNVTATDAETKLSDSLNSAKQKVNESTDGNL